MSLRDGSVVVVRPIRPEDKEALLAGFSRLSPGSRYRRFLTPMRTLTRSQLAYLTEVDHRDHEALMAFESESGEGVAVARYVREPGTARAEAAVTVLDDWQGRGLGTALTRRLADRAIEQGIATFTALLLADNTEMLDLLRSVGEDLQVTPGEPGTVEVVVPLEREPDKSRGLLAILRAAAAASLRLASSPGERGQA